LTGERDKKKEEEGETKQYIREKKFGGGENTTKIENSTSTVMFEQQELNLESTT